MEWHRENALCKNSVSYIRERHFSAKTQNLSSYAVQKCGDKFHLWVRRKVKEQADVPKLTETFIKKNPDCIVICNEVGCGVVPMLKEEREYREQVGRMQVILAKSSESVERVICGIAQKMC